VPETRRVVVLGGTGFIGSYLVQELLADGFQVGVVSRHSVDVNRERYPPEQLDCRQGDVADVHFVADALIDADVCIHLVHSTVPGESMSDPAREIVDSVVPTVRCLSRLPSRRFKRFVYVSSGGTVYGNARLLPISEDHPTDPMSAYGVAKLSLEKYVGMFAQTLNLNTAIVRPANVYGLGRNLNRDQGAVGIFLNRMLHNEPIQIWGDGSIVRDYLYVTDVARAIALVAADFTPGVWNVGTGVGTSLIDMIRLLEQIMRSTAKVAYAPARGYDVPVNILDAARIRKLLAWVPEVGLAQGIQTMYSAIRRGPDYESLLWRRDKQPLLSM
jgi:UDP-glucose 4-epimerase